jgi:hypothetical protein
MPQELITEYYNGAAFNNTIPNSIDYNSGNNTSTMMNNSSNNTLNDYHISNDGSNMMMNSENYGMAVGNDLITSLRINSLNDTRNVIHFLDKKKANKSTNIIKGAIRKSEYFMKNVIDNSICLVVLFNLNSFEVKKTLDSFIQKLSNSSGGMSSSSSGGNLLKLPNTGGFNQENDQLIKFLKDLYLSGKKSNHSTSFILFYTAKDDKIIHFSTSKIHL